VSGSPTWSPKYCIPMRKMLMTRKSIPARRNRCLPGAQPAAIAASGAAPARASR
jgi:hypothetical protein